MEYRFYQLKVELLDIEPTIWRQFVVPAHIPLDRLHDVIQIVMGWRDCHLHEFTFKKQQYTEAPETKDYGLEEGNHRLADLVKRKGSKFHYLYDFGDSWQHELTLENSRYKFPEDIFGHFAILTCLDGKGACPPEDVGGPPGYLNFCEAISDPEHPEHENYLHWCGGSFNCTHFNANDVNDEFMKYLRWSRPRYLDW